MAVSRELTVDVLLQNVLFVAVDGFDPVQPGNVLVRNLELGRTLTKKHKGVKERNTFVVYQNIYDALRGLRAIPHQYDRVEIGRIQGWQKTLQWMLEASWQLKDASSDTVKAYQNVGADTVAKESSVRDPNKVTARERTRNAASITDSRGRKNPGRIPPLLWSSSDLLAKRQGAVRGISHRIDARVYALACYLDSLMRMRDRYEIMVAHLLGSGVLRGKCTAPRILSAMADRLRQSADDLRLVNVEPFVGYCAAVADLLTHAAESLQSGNVNAARDHCLHRAQIKLYLMDARRELEEILSAMASYRDQDIQPSFEAWQAFERKMTTVRDWIIRIVHSDYFSTGRNPIGEINSALTLLNPSDETDDRRFTNIYDCLKNACRACG